MKRILVFVSIALLFASCTSISETETTSNLERSMIQSNPTLPDISGSVVVNIEGVIKEVSKDGKKFLLSNGTWIITDRSTKMGISEPTAAPKEDQYFEPSFRVGNQIAGFSQIPEGEMIVAYAIYTNWNWEDPIR